MMSSVADVPATYSREERKLLERGAWLPIGSAGALRDLTPTRVEIAGKKLAVWRTVDPKTGEDQWAVMADACSHRLAPLSQGRVDPATGCVECPYHGWQFRADGACTKIPQAMGGSGSGSGSGPPLPSAPAPASPLSVASLPVRLTGDIIWGFFDDARPDLRVGETRPFEEFPRRCTRGCWTRRTAPT